MEEVEQFNKILEDKYNIRIITYNGEFVYNYQDIYNNLIKIDMDGSKRKYKSVKVNGNFKYLYFDSLIDILNTNRNGIPSDLIIYNNVLNYDNTNILNVNALKLYNGYSFNIFNNILFTRIPKEYMPIVTRYKNNKIAHGYFEKHLYFYNYNYYIDSKGLAIVNFIKYNNYNDLSLFNIYIDDFILNNQSLFKNIRGIVFDDNIFYLIKDIAREVESFTQVGDFIKKYNVKSINIGKKILYINQRDIKTCLEKIETIKAINICIKNKFNENIYIKNKIFNYNNSIYIKEITDGSNKIRCIFQGKNIKLINLTDLSRSVSSVCNLLKKEKLYYIHIHNEISKFIFIDTLTNLIENNMHLNPKRFIKIINIFDNYAKINYFKMSNINKEIYDNDIFYFKDSISEVKKYFNLDSYNPNITKKFQYIEYNNDMYIIINDFLSHIFNGKYKINNYICIKYQNKIQPVSIIDVKSFINVLSKTKKPTYNNLKDELNLTKIYMPLLESTTLPIIINAFPHIKFKQQHLIKNQNNLYYLDLAILKNKICIECDENNHKSYDKTSEKNREDYLKSQGWKIIRYNPNIPKEIGNAIYEIHKIIYD